MIPDHRLSITPYLLKQRFPSDFLILTSSPTTNKKVTISDSWL